MTTAARPLLMTRGELATRLAAVMAMGIGVLLMWKDALVAVHPVLLWLPMALAAACWLVAGASLVSGGQLRVAPVFLWYAGYVGVMTFNSLLIGRFGAVPEAVAVGFVTLLFFLLFWTTLYNTAAFDVYWFLDGMVGLSGIVALLAFYQFYVDHSLFGIVTTVYGQAAPNVTRRAVSIFGTPQVLGIFMAICVAYMLARPKRKSWYLILPLDIVAMVLTGTKSISIFFAVFLVAYARRLRMRDRILGGALLILLLVVGYQTVPLVHRVLEPIDFLIERRGDARILIWLRYFNASDWFDVIFGHGVGTAERIAFNRLGYAMDSAESYLLKVYYELGITGVGLFLGTYLTAARALARSHRTLALLLYAFLTNLVVVHVYAGLFMSFFVSAIVAYGLALAAADRQTRFTEALAGKYPSSG